MNNNNHKFNYTLSKYQQNVKTEKLEAGHQKELQELYNMSVSLSPSWPKAHMIIKREHHCCLSFPFLLSSSQLTLFS